ncbi:MAG: cytochrome-c peroxidase, partial [Gemmatimonadaceae bacterium]
MRTISIFAVVASAIAAGSSAYVPRLINESGKWSKDQQAMLLSLSLASLPHLPSDPSNRYADDSAAATLGHQLFFDTRLSGNGKVSCATCHIPDKSFQDSRMLGEGVGVAGRRTMPIAGTAYSPWQFWDGRADSQWSQALGPLESAVEHGGDRLQYAHLIAAEYRDAYQAVFGALPDLSELPSHAGPVADTARSRAWKRIVPVRQMDISRVYANVGKAIAAYERRIQFTPSRFDRYVAEELARRPHTVATMLSADEESGLRLFIGKANCATCHNGPLLTDNHFHNTGVPQSSLGAPHDSGRAVGVRSVLTAEFNCLGKYSDAKPEECGELRFTETDNPEMLRAFRKSA